MAKKIHFYLVVSNMKEEWKEPYCKPGITSLKKAEEWGRQVVEDFNKNLRQFELARRFVRVELIEE